MSVRTKAQIKADIDSTVTTNGVGAITGANLNAVLTNVKDSYQDVIVEMTTTARDSISSPVDNQLIFNTTTSRYEFYLSGTWQQIPSETGGISYRNEVILKASGNTDMDNAENDDWKIEVSGNNLAFFRRESGTFVEKSTITP